MKRSFTKLLLALSLVINPVAVLASDFYTVGMLASQPIHGAPCHPTKQQENLVNPEQLDHSNCEMPCCEDQDCSENCDCALHYSTALLNLNLLKFKASAAFCCQKVRISAVPDRELPPENPPPIHS